MYEQKQGDKDILLVQGAKHGKSIGIAPHIYGETVDDFLKMVI
jgi:hypothetical protein